MRLLRSCLIVWAVHIAVLVVFFLALPVMGQPTPAVATPEKAVVLSIMPPQGTTAVFLDLWIQAYTPPQRGAVEAVVVLAVPGSDRAIEIGRFAVFPSTPFLASEASQQRAYRFDASAALAALRPTDKPLEVRVRLEPMDARVLPEGAQLTLGKVAFSPRP